MKQLIALGLGAFSLVAAGAASAADLPARAPAMKAPVYAAPGYNWTGFYVGINGGGAWSHSCWDFVPVAGVALREGCSNGNGGLAGGQIGFNWQSGPLVLGVELSGDWTSLTGNNNSLVFVAPQNVNRTKVDAIAAATGRVGYAMDVALLYVKGGGAWADSKYTATAAGVVTATGSATRTGWTVGGGIEYGFAPNWSVAVEYDHYDFGRDSITFTGPGAGVDRVGQTVDAVTARVNWRFGWGGPVSARY
jgi:outer membrane immunogenic protein